MPATPKPMQEFEQILLEGDSIGAGDAMALFDMPETVQEGFANGWNRRHELAAMLNAERAGQAGSSGPLMSAVARLLRDIRRALKGELVFEALASNADEVEALSRPNRVSGLGLHPSPTPPTTPTRVIVEIEGGAIRGLTATEPVDVILVDFDTQGCELSSLKSVADADPLDPQASLAMVYPIPVVVDAKYVGKIEAIEGNDSQPSSEPKEPGADEVGVQHILRTLIDFEPPREQSSEAPMPLYIKIMTEEREGVTVDRLLWRGKTAASVRLRIEATGPDARERLVAACTTIRAELNAIGATEYEAELVPARSESPADASQENAIMDGPHG